MSLYVPAPPTDTTQSGVGSSGKEQWESNLNVQRLLLIGMFACIGWSLALALEAMGLTWQHALALLLVATLVYAVGLALGRRADGRSLRRYTEYGITDWVLLLIPILLVLKLLPRFLDGPAAVLEELQSWASSPARFFDMTLVWSFLLVFFVWDESLRQGEDLARLSLQPDEQPPDADPNSIAYQSWESSAYRFVDHAGAWRRVMLRFVIGGFVLLILTGIATIPSQALGDPNRPEVTGVFPHVLAYYLLGMMLAGQTSLNRLRASWLRQSALVQPGLARRWIAYGAALVGAALLLALLLPTTSVSDSAAESLPLLGVLLWPLRLLFAGLNWLLSHLAALILAPIAWLLPRGVPGAGSPTAGFQAPPAPQPLPAGDAPIGTSWISRVLFGFLFYVAPLLLAAYAIWNTWRKRRAIVDGVRAFGRDALALLWGGLLDLVASLWRLLSFGSPRLLGWAPQAIQARLRRRRRGPSSPESGAMSWLRLRALDPRQLIQYFYVSTAQRAGNVGWARGKGQTAYEYSRMLAERMPERRDEVEQLTEAFVRAKYSPMPVSRDDARRARPPWERVRGALQIRRRGRQVGSWFGLRG
jgi:hypothetical protein